MEKYTFEMDKDTKDRIENFIKAYDLDVNINKTEQPEEEQWPQARDICYAIKTAGDVSDFIWSGCPFDRHVAEIGNCFRTKEEAEFEAERRKVLAEMKKFAEPEDRIWDGENQHWVIYLNIYNGSINIDYYTIHKYDLIYFESAEKAEECVKAIGIGKIRKYYLGVEFKE